VTQDAGPINPAWIPRDEVLNRMEELMKENGGDREKARKEWENESDYHARSVVETLMYRFKQLCGEKLFSRKTAFQLREVAMKVTMRNKLPSLGRPVFSVAYNSPDFRTWELLTLKSTLRNNAYFYVVFWGFRALCFVF
jgi:hypothetical protein